MPDAAVEIELPTDATPVAVAAEMYARAGFAPIRVHGWTGTSCTCGASTCTKNAGKHPVEGGWQAKPTDDIDVVRERFRRHRGNIGLVGGHNRIVFVDFDGDAGGWDSLEKHFADMPTTLCATTGSGNGAHFAFRAAKHHDLTSIRTRKGVLPGVDVRSVGGMIVAAPSLHQSGNRYRWDVAVSPVVMPDWIYAKIRQDRQVAAAVTPIGPRTGMYERVRAYVAKMDPAIQGSNGSGACFEVANVVANNGLTEAEQWAILREYNERCDPPWSEKELTHKLESGRSALNKRVLPDRERPTQKIAYRPSNDDRQGGGGAPPPPPDETSWKSACLWETTRSGATRLREVAENAVIIFQNDPQWRGKIRWDRFGQTITVRDPPWLEHQRAGRRDSEVWTPNDTRRAQGWLLRQEDPLKLTKEAIDDAINVVAERNDYHSVEEWLSGLKWDGVPRIGGWLIKYCGAEETDYVRAVGRWWLISGVARAMEPGCQVDVALILEGAQGIGKTTVFRTLARKPEWYRSGVPDIEDPIESARALEGKFIVEFAELNSMRKADVKAIKDFITETHNRYRRMRENDYGNRPRSCIFGGSTNESEYLNDPSGARRFWPVHCTKVARNDLERDADQLWAEAVEAYHNGAKWYEETEGDTAMCNAEQERRLIGDPWLPDVLSALERYRDDMEAVVDGKRMLRCTSELILRALDLDVSRRDHNARARVGAILRALKWTYSTRTARIEGGVKRYWYVMLD